MELARLRNALGEGRTLELEIDKLRALLGVLEADVRILRQVKHEKGSEGELRDCTDGEFILRSPERRKRMLSQAVKSSHALVLPEAEVQSPPPPILAQEPPGSNPHPSVPQGLRSVKSAVELHQLPGGRKPLSPIAPCVRATGSRHHFSGSKPGSPGPPQPGIAWNAGARTPDASPSQLPGLPPNTAWEPQRPANSGQADRSLLSSGSSLNLAIPKRDHCWYCGQPWPEKEPAQGSGNRVSAGPLEAGAGPSLFQRLEAAGIGPWQIAELKRSEARLAEIAAEAPIKRTR
ncbi:unnamed protein product [Symbiodinium sp. CCMP2592]|nr:unnamed protein product [Symbiodinium sp. CCMP2592]